jgi:hypothetical protein
MVRRHASAVSTGASGSVTSTTPSEPHPYAHPPGSDAQSVAGQANGIHPPALQAGLGAAYRQPVAWGLESLISWMQSAEEWQRAQLDGMHICLKRHQDVQERLQHSQDFSEMAALQAELMRFNFANSMQLVQRCMDVAMHSQTAAARLWSSALDSGRSHWISDAWQALQGGMHTGFKPMDDILSAPLYRELFSFHQNRQSA